MVYSRRHSGKNIGSRAHSFWACDNCAQTYRRPQQKPEDRKCIACGHGTIVSWDSKGELARWMELRILEKAGEICRLERQYSLTLKCDGRHLLNENGRKMKAVIDFRYYDKKGAFDVLEDYKPRDRSGRLILTPEASVKLALVNAMWSGAGRMFIVGGKEFAK